MTEEKSPEQQKIEADAIAQGWNADYTGENARTAEEFLSVGKKISAVQSDNNKKLLDKVEGLETTLQEQANSFKEFQDHQFKVIAEAKKDGYDKAVSEIEAKKLKAVEDGDTEEYKALEREKKDLKKPEVAATTPKKPAIDPLFKEWHKENQWYKVNSPDDMSIAADVFGKLLIDREPTLTGADYYKKVEKHIKTVFPDSFKPADSKIDTGGHDPKPNKGGKSYSDLPAEAKKACDMQCEKLGIKKEEYATNYFAGE